MLIVDAHEDIAYNAVCFDRDYRRSAEQTRKIEAASGSTRGTVTLGLPNSLLGRVGVTFATLFTAPKSGDSTQFEAASYTTPKEAYQLALKQWDYYQKLADQDDRVRLVRTQSELDAVLATWAEGKEMSDHRQGLVLLMEGADPILEPRQFEEWYERGVRIVGPAWEATRYSGGTGYPGPLTPLGFELLEVMASFNAIIDLSHMSELAFLQAVERYEGPIIASHSNPRRFRDTDRHLSDDMIRRLAERDGVMGIVFFNRFLSERWSPGDPKSTVPLSIVIDAIDYVCQLTGSANHVGIGTDLDGGFGSQSIPEEIDTVTDVYTVAGRLRERGYDEGQIEAIMGGNMLRKLRQSLPR